MWEIKSVEQGSETKYLEEGWEPFGVSGHDMSYPFTNTSLRTREVKHQTTDYIYLRREKKDGDWCF